MTILTDEERASKLVAQIKNAELERDGMIELIDNLKASLYKIVGDGEHGVRVGDDMYKVESYMGKTFNSAYLLKENPQAWDKASVTKRIVTAESAQAVLTDEEYAQGQKPNTKRTVKVSLLND